MARGNLVCVSGEPSGAPFHVPRTPRRHRPIAAAIPNRCIGDSQPLHFYVIDVYNYA